VWQDNSNNQNRIEARLFGSQGNALSPDLLLSGASLDAQDPAISINQETGDFVTVWADDANQNGLYEIKMHSFSSVGTEIIPITIVNTNSTGQQMNPSVAVNTSGKFVVVWQDDSDNNNFFNINLRGFDAAGVEIITERTVNNYLSGDQKFPVVAMNGNGSFVVSWQGPQIPTTQNQGTAADPEDIFARAFNPNGSPINAVDITLSRVSTGTQSAPDISIDGNNHYIVVSEDDRDGNKYRQIIAVGKIF
jgi:hypothetical protein